MCILTTWVDVTDDCRHPSRGRRRTTGCGKVDPSATYLPLEAATKLGSRRSREGYILFVMPIAKGRIKCNGHRKLTNNFDLCIGFGDAQRPLRLG